MFTISCVPLECYALWLSPTGSCLAFLITTHCCLRLISGKSTGRPWLYISQFSTPLFNLRRHSNSRPRRGKVNEPSGKRSRKVSLLDSNWIDSIPLGFLINLKAPNSIIELVLFLLHALRFTLFHFLISNQMQTTEGK